MKYTRFSLVIIATMAAGSCSIKSLDKDVQVSSIKEGRVVFTAEYAVPDTKTSMHDETSIWWSPDDEICVFYGESGKNRFVSEETESSQKAHFIGSINAFTGTTESGDFNYFWALYPYDAAISCDGNSVVAELTDHQTAKAGTFADNTNITLAKSSGLALSFYNVCSGFRFSVTHEGIKSVTFRGNDNENIAGTFSVSMDSAGKPTEPVVIDGRKEVTLSAPAGETFEVGPLYYIEILPQVLKNGFTLTFHTDDSFGSRSIERSADFKRSSFNRGLDFDASVVYSQYPTNEIRYTSTDGAIVVPHNPDAFGATIVSNTYENGRGTILFDGDVTVFGDQTFESCNNLKSLDIPQTVTEIKCSLNGLPNLEGFSGKFATSDGRFLVDDGRLVAVAGKGLTELTVPDCVSIIGKGSLQCLNDVKTINIPEGVSLEEGSRGNVFLRDENLERITGPYASEDGRFLIFNDSVMGFAPADLYDINIPQGVKTIPDEAFRYGRIFPTSGEHFGTVSIPESVTGIGSCAFWDFKADRFVFNSTVPAAAGYSWLSEDTEIFVPVGYVETYRNADGWGDLHDMITSEGCRVYYTTTDNQIIETERVYTVISNTYEEGQGIMVFENELTEIGNQYGWDLGGETTLETITLPACMRYICGNSFIGCNSLRQIISPYATSDGRCFVSPNGSVVQAFAPKGLTVYAIPDGVKGIGLDAFNQCSNLKQILIPEGVTSISDAAFYHCTSLQTITLPESLEELGYNVFSECESLKAIYGKFTDDDHRSIIFEGKLLGVAPAGIDSYSIPEGVTEISAGAIQVYDAWSELVIPASVSSIAYGAFRYSTFDKISIFASAPPAIDWHLEANLAERILVPSNSVNAYKSDIGWSILADKIFPMDDGSNEPLNPGEDY